VAGCSTIHPRTHPAFTAAGLTEPGSRDRSLITCAALITNGSTKQLRAHLGIAKSNGVTEGELKEVIIHLPSMPGGREPRRR
jgi:alkylhydroperoxidase/carboxymuconolactone decarboxylase family protein YurZ